MLRAPHSTLALAHLVLAATGALAVAGPLDPPAGPITPTSKTLTDVEPRTAINAINTPGDADSLFKITQPGAYYLTGNVAGVSGKSGIEIAASGVTLDLSGFELLGVPGSGRGIVASATSLTNIEISNGSVRGWGNIGVDLNSNLPGHCSVRNVRASHNANTGIVVTNGSTVIQCVAASNGLNGITANSGCLVADCIAVTNTIDGIEVNNGGAHDCVSIQNGSDGFETSSGVVLSACAASGNSSDGFNLSSACSISGCTAMNNGGNGITVVIGSTVAGNACRTNGFDGIIASSGCIITGNTCTGNGTDPGTGAGIHVNSGDNRIEGNNCTGQDRGIDVDGAGNFIVRNTCSGNTTNWEIVANNVFGPIINRTSPASAAVTGDSAASSLGSTDANANYTY